MKKLTIEGMGSEKIFITITIMFVIYIFLFIQFTLFHSQYCWNTIFVFNYPAFAIAKRLY